MTEIERSLYFGDFDPQRCSIRKQLCTYEFRTSISDVFLKQNYLNAFNFEYFEYFGHEKVLSNVFIKASAPLTYESWLINILYYYKHPLDHLPIKA